MRYGIGVFFIFAGLFLTFASKMDIPYVDSHALGWICIGVGLLALALAYQWQRRATVRTNQNIIEHRDTTGEPPLV